MKTNENKYIRFGVIGAGGFADKRALPAFKKSEQFILDAVMVRDRERAKQIATRHGAEKYYDTIEDLLHDDDIDAVYICTPVYLHHSQTLDAIEAGKHVFCEKPMALSENECQEMIDAAQMRNVKIGINFQMRCHAGFTQLKSMIEDGQFGNIYLIRTQLHLSYPPDKNLQWRYQPDKSGGGVIMDVGSHCLDLLEFFGGNISSVHCLTEKRQQNKVEDLAITMVRFENGAVGISDNSFLTDDRVNIIEIYGDRMTVLGLNAIGPFESPDFYVVKEGETEPVPTKWVNPYTRIIDEFIQAIVDGENIPVNGMIGKRNIQIIKAAYQSAQSGKFVNVC